MGIFSFLGKKEREPDEAESDKDALRRKREGDTSRIGTPRAPSRSSQTVQRDAALATAKKIDAIESEMTSELARPTQKAASQTAAGKAQRPAAPPPPTPAAAIPGDATRAPAAKAGPATLPTMGMSTDFLLGSNSRTGSVEISSSETPPVIEEAAILFANEQHEMVEQMLLSAIHDSALGEMMRTVWLMLFDLYQIIGKQDKFETLSIEYAAKFETSPPAWDSGRLDPAATIQPMGATPALTFTGKLDETIVKQLDRAQKLSEKNHALRLEFSRVTEVLPAGCELMLAALKKLQKTGYELILVGAPDFATKIRAILEVGRRDDSDAPWLLLLEILQLLNREQEFEEASIDYCVTFEVSPPAFVAPKKVSTATDMTEPDMASEKFMMPTVIDGRSNVIATISEFAASHNPAIIDCARLTRVDFSAAGQLLSALAPIAGKGKIVELHNVNYLVAALFQVMGLRDIARVLLRKN